MKNFFKKCLKFMSLSVVLATLNFLNAQNTSINTFNQEDIPESIAETLKTATRVDIYNIGVEVLEDDLIVADKVVFNEGAVASLHNFKWPRLIIYANELVFANPRIGAQILRKIDAEAPTPIKPATPASQPNAGRSGTHGNPGARGINGSSGLKGITYNIPDIWIITNNILTPKGRKIGNTLNFRIFVPGINGSNGGDGGDGGKGGDGGTGRHGSINAFRLCQRQPGSGGNGGQGGSGGKAGDGGDGGNGGNVYFVGPKRVIDVLQFTSIQNNGADAGTPGLPGKPGAAGHGGARGSRPGNCSGGRRGGNGSAASPAHLGLGKVGVDGKKGETVAYIIDDVRTLVQ